MEINDRWKIENEELVYSGHLPKTEIEAWRVTLEKWAHVYSFSSKIKYGGGPMTCGLCLLCDFTSNDTCDNCPIELYTGYPECRNTPYIVATQDDATQDEIIKEINFLLKVLGTPEWAERDPIVNSVRMIVDAHENNRV